jgi:hypothetical protein
MLLPYGLQTNGVPNANLYLIDVQAVLVSVVALALANLQLAAAAPQQLAAGEAASVLSADGQGRPGDVFSPTCGSQGMSVCSDACITMGEYT